MIKIIISTLISVYFINELIENLHNIPLTALNIFLSLVFTSVAIYDIGKYVKSKKESKHE